MINALKQFRSSKVFSDIRIVGEYAIRIFNYLLLGMILLIGYKACNTEGEIDGALFTYDRATGHWELGAIHTEKKVKETKKDTFMVDIGIDNNGIRTYGFKRRIWSPLGMGIWGGAFIREGIHPRSGNQFAGGVTLSISF